MLSLLNSSDYIKVKRDPTTKIFTDLKSRLLQIKKQHRLTVDFKKWLTPMQPSAPQMYGLPKIHKLDIPMRPIVCTIGSPLYLLSKYLSKILSPLVGHSDSYIKNSTHFVNRISDIVIDDSDLLVSFDVKSLFTMVPIEDSITIIRDRLVADLH